MSNAIDLTTLAAVKGYAEIPAANTGDDSIISDTITAFSQWVLSITGQGSLNSIVAYTSEIYDGNGKDRIFVRNQPITSVEAVIANGVTIPPSSGYPAPGWVIDQSKKSIAIIGGGSTRGWPLGGAFRVMGATAPAFTRGIANVSLSYHAGYSATPFDLEYACRQACAVYYKRHQTIDQASKAINTAGGGSGTLRYRDWAVPPEVASVLFRYKRVAIVT